MDDNCDDMQMQKKQTWNDYIGDTIVWAMDECKFWTEVISEYMEWDESSAQRIA